MRTLSDYIRWRNDEKYDPKANIKLDEFRPPIIPTMYDKPQTDLWSPLDKDPIVQRVFIKPKINPPSLIPWSYHPAFRFFAGAFSGAMLTFLVFQFPMMRKEWQDLVLYDPQYFPEFAALRQKPKPQ